MNFINSLAKRIYILGCFFVISCILFASVLPIQAFTTHDFFTDDSNDYVSFDDAYTVANNKLISLGKEETFSIDHWEIIKDEDSNQNLFFVFHLNPVGYVIVSSFYFTHPVIAYSFTSNTGVGDVNPLYDLLSADLSYQVEMYDQLTENVLLEYNQEWHQFIFGKVDDAVLSMQEQWPPEGTTDTEGWIETQWHQSAPYNNFCPIDPDSGDRGIAGCPAITMGQILHYHKTINNIQFNDSDDYYHNFMNRFYIDDDHEEYDFPSFPELNEYLSTLQNHYETGAEITDEDVAALSFACAVAATQVFSPQVSGTYGVDQAMDAYQRFGFENAKLYYKDSSQEVFNTIIWNIKHALPVHFAVVTPAWNSGHNLNIDGYNTDDYYHLNFGWGGTHDGWYHIPDELPYELTVIEGVIVDIMNISSDEDLTCYGQLTFQDLEAGASVNGEFTLENTGNPASMLDWEVASVPSWGEWTISPDSGAGLTPEDGSITIDVSLVVPNKKNKDFSGSIEVINKNNPSDREYIPISVSTAKVKSILPLVEYLENMHYPLIQFVLMMLKNL